MNATEHTTGNAHGHCITVESMLLEADNSEGPPFPDSTVVQYGTKCSILYCIWRLTSEFNKNSEVLFGILKKAVVPQNKSALQRQKRLGGLERVCKRIRLISNSSATRENDIRIHTR
jgi:hypothetical protein